ncbi:MAG: hypothetical protein KJ579_01405 [Verrucomicrobia bacterium]|nr:hypothetical protein [Verrucomicrobiota bacterium]
MNNQQKDDLRHAALQFLYERSLLAFAPEAVARLTYRRGMVDFEPTLDDARAALELLRGLGLVEAIRDPLGSAVSYKITAAGTLAVERGEA